EAHRGKKHIHILRRLLETQGRAAKDKSFLLGARNADRGHRQHQSQAAAKATSLMERSSHFGHRLNLNRIAVPASTRLKTPGSGTETTFKLLNHPCDVRLSRLSNRSKKTLTDAPKNWDGMGALTSYELFVANTGCRLGYGIFLAVIAAGSRGSPPGV